MKEKGGRDDFNKGVKNGLILYGLGTLITVIFHIAFGWDYGHAPPPSFIIVLITLLIGLFRFFATLNGFITKDSKKAKGEFIVHGVVAVLVILFFVWIRYSY